MSSLGAPDPRKPAPIRRTLLLWYGAFLIAAIVGLGGLHYIQTSSAVLGTVDASLRDRGSAIAAALEYDAVDGWELELSQDYLQGLSRETWFSIRTEDGRLIYSEGRCPDVDDAEHKRLARTDSADPETSLVSSGPPDAAAARTDASASALRVAPTIGFQSDERDLRELVLRGIRNSTIRIGRSVAAERMQMRSLLVGILLSGGAVVLAALLGGHWIANRVLRPIESMSVTAAGISERDLSGRIREEDLPEELRDLAQTLNDTFARLDGAFGRQTRFTADASHELRTPVAVIRAQVEATLAQEREPEKYRATLRACLRAAERMTGVVEGLLTLARFDAEESRPAECVDLVHVTREVVDLAMGTADEVGIVFEPELESLTVRGDAHLLGEVVSNLLSNAIHYNRPQGTIEIRLHVREDAALIEVEDTGIGIPTADLSRIYERFFRVDPARSRARGGTGLGLSIAHWIVQQHNGSISVESQVGVGSTFTVQLPLLDPEAPTLRPGTESSARR